VLSEFGTVKAKVSEDSHVHSPSSRWLVATAVMSSAVMEVLDTSVVNVSLPHIAGSLSATINEATWVLTSYIVANAVILPITGWLANFVGRKKLLLSVITGFTASSVLCGLAPNLSALIFFRVMQGLTGGGLQPLSQAVLLEEFPQEKRGQAMAFWGLGIVVAPILGPTLGGWLTDAYSWRWVFYINLPIGILSLLMIQNFVHDPPHINRGGMRVDIMGLSLLVIGMGALQVMLDKGQEEDWFSSHFIVALAVTAAIALPCFVIRELRTDQPLVRFQLLKDRSFATGIALVFVLGVVLYGSLILLPLYMQTLLGWTAMTAGIWTSPRGLAVALCMPLVGQMLSRGWDGRKMLAWGFIVAGLSFFGYSHMTLQSGTWDIFLCQLCQGFGTAFIFIPLTTLTMDPIPNEQIGYATALYSVTRNIGSSVGISAVTTMLARWSQVHQNFLAAHVTPYDPRTREFLTQASQYLTQAGAGSVRSGQQSLGLVYGMIQQQAALLSFLDAFRVMGLMFLIVTPLIFLMRRSQTGKRD
jgi:DHA2 family multidrug resistance protein